MPRNQPPHARGSGLFSWSALAPDRGGVRQRRDTRSFLWGASKPAGCTFLSSWNPTTQGQENFHLLKCPSGLSRGRLMLFDYCCIQGLTKTIHFGGRRGGIFSVPVGNSPSSGHSWQLIFVGTTAWAAGLAVVGIGFLGRWIYEIHATKNRLFIHEGYVHWEKKWKAPVLEVGLSRCRQNMVKHVK